MKGADGDVGWLRAAEGDALRVEAKPLAAAITDALEAGPAGGDALRRYWRKRLCAVPIR